MLPSWRGFFLFLFFASDNFVGDYYLPLLCLRVYVRTPILLSFSLHLVFKIIIVRGRDGAFWHGRVGMWVSFWSDSMVSLCRIMEASSFSLVPKAILPGKCVKRKQLPHAISNHVSCEIHVGTGTTILRKIKIKINKH